MHSRTREPTGGRAKPAQPTPHRCHRTTFFSFIYCFLVPGAAGIAGAVEAWEWGMCGCTYCRADSTSVRRTGFIFEARKAARQSTVLTPRIDSISMPKYLLTIRARGQWRRGAGGACNVSQPVIGRSVGRSVSRVSPAVSGLVQWSVLAVCPVPAARSRSRAPSGLSIHNISIHIIHIREMTVAWDGSKNSRAQKNKNSRVLTPTFFFPFGFTVPLLV